MVEVVKVVSNQIVKVKVDGASETVILLSEVNPKKVKTTRIVQQNLLRESSAFTGRKA